MRLRRNPVDPDAVTEQEPSWTGIDEAVDEFLEEIPGFGDDDPDEPTADTEPGESRWLRRFSTALVGGG